MSGTLILGIPSKGRLEAQAADLFKQAGMTLHRSDARGYQGRLDGFDDILVQYLSAGEIARRLAAGEIHFGVTGLDLMHEEASDMENAIALLQPLGFGRADVVVAVPDEWHAADMDDLIMTALRARAEDGSLIRVATKYENLAHEFFADHGFTQYEWVESSGATEGAPADGVADIIVDITTTGATLAANNLQRLSDGTILQSEAYLAASLRALWPEAALEDTARWFLARLDAYFAATQWLIVRIDVDAMAAPYMQGIESETGARVISSGEAHQYAVPTDRLKDFMNRVAELSQYNVLSLIHI